MENNIRGIIETNKLTITSVIEKVGLARSSFYEIMNGNAVPNLINARKIAEVLETDLDEIFPDFNTEV